MSEVPGYLHTQNGIIRPIMLFAAVIWLVLAYASRGHVVPLVVLTAGAVVIGVFSFAFASLTIRDEGDRLAVRFGPLSVFRMSIPYERITGVERDRVGLPGGMGIHWTRKGWLWNIRMGPCVRIQMGPKTLLLGTDDPEGFVAFLRSRIEENDPAGSRAL